VRGKGTMGYCLVSTTSVPFILHGVRGVGRGQKTRLSLGEEEVEIRGR